MTPTSGAGHGSAAAVDAQMRIGCRSADEAKRLHQALAVDDAAVPGGAALEVRDRALLVTASSASALGLLRTLDDLLGCVRAAEPEL